MYSWDFSDGLGVQTGNPINYSYKYMNDYDVIMSINLNGRLIYRTHKLVNAKGQDPKPTAKFQQTEESVNTNSITWTFNSQSTILHGGIDSYQWDFGDGTTDNQYSSFIKKVYQRSTTGISYPIRLIVSGNGCFDTIYNSVYIPAK